MKMETAGKPRGNTKASMIDGICRHQEVPWWPSGDVRYEWFWRAAGLALKSGGELGAARHQGQHVAPSRSMRRGKAKHEGRVSVRC